MRSYWLEAGDGTVLSLDGPEYAALIGAAGLGIVGSENTWAEGAGGGGRFRRQRKLKRTLVLPVLITGRDYDHALELYEALAGMLEPMPTVGNPGGVLPRLNVQTNDDVWWTAVAHESGGDPGDGGQEGANWLLVNLTLTAGSPYWTRAEVETQSARPGVIGRGLIKNASLSKLRLSAGQITGEVTLMNPGPVPVYPTVTISGPATSLILTSPLGEVLTWSGVLTAAQRRIIDHEAGTVVDQDGVNRYNELGPSPRFWALQPGVQVAGVVLQGSSPGSRAVGPTVRTNWVRDPGPYLTGLTAGWTIAGALGEVFLNPQQAQATPLSPGPDGAMLYLRHEVGAEKTSAADPTILRLRDPLDYAGKAGDVFIARRWVRASVDAEFRPRLQPAQNGNPYGNTSYGDTVYAPAGVWVEVSVTATASFDYNSYQFDVYGYGVVFQGGSWDQGRAILEMGNQARPYFDGFDPDTDAMDYTFQGDVATGAPSLAREVILSGQSSVDMSWFPRRRVVR